MAKATDLYQFVDQQPQEVEADKGAHLWVQWEGTDLCADFHCRCGARGHIDADFVYAVKCLACGTRYAMPCHLPLYAIPEDVLSADDFWTKDEHITTPEMDRADE